MSITTKLEAACNELLEEAKNEDNGVKEVVIVVKYSSPHTEPQIRRISSSNS